MMANGRGCLRLLHAEPRSLSPAGAASTAHVGRPGREEEEEEEEEEGPSTTAASKPAPAQEKRGSLRADAAAAAAARRKKYRRHGKPPYSYLALIALAIRGSPDEKLTLAQIIGEIDRLFSFEDQYEGWKESIRHNLSASACFFQELKDPTNPRSKGNFWRVNVDLIPPGALKLQNTPISRQEGAGLAPDLAPFILEGRPYVPPWCRVASQAAQPLSSTEGGDKQSQTPSRPFTVQYLLQGLAEAGREGELKADTPCSLAAGNARVPTMPSAFTERPCLGLPTAFSPLPPPSYHLGCQLPASALWTQLPWAPFQGALACPVMTVPCPFLTVCPMGPPGSLSAPIPFYPTCCTALPVPPFPLLASLGYPGAPREQPWTLGTSTLPPPPPCFTCSAVPPGHPS